jgi:hypothetical protein
MGCACNNKEKKTNITKPVEGFNKPHHHHKWIFGIFIIFIIMIIIYMMTCNEKEYILAPPNYIKGARGEFWVDFNRPNYN